MILPSPLVHFVMKNMLIRGATELAEVPGNVLQPGRVSMPWNPFLDGPVPAAHDNAGLIMPSGRAPLRHLPAWPRGSRGAQASRWRGVGEGEDLAVVDAQGDEGGVLAVGLGEGLFGGGLPGGVQVVRTGSPSVAESVPSRRPPGCALASPVARSISSTAPLRSATGAVGEPSEERSQGRVLAAREGGPVAVGDVRRSRLLSRSSRNFSVSPAPRVHQGQPPVHLPAAVVLFAQRQSRLVRPGAQARDRHLRGDGDAEGAVLGLLRLPAAVSRVCRCRGPR